MTPSIGSSTIRSTGSVLAIRSIAAAGVGRIASEPLAVATATSVSSNEDCAAASFSSTGPSFSSALSPVFGSEACPASPSR